MSQDTPYTRPWITAFSFKVPLTQDELNAKLIKVVAAAQIRENSLFGDYLEIIDPDSGSKLRVFVQGDHFAFDLYNAQAECTAEAWDKEIKKNITLLEKLGAAEFEQTEHFY